MQRPQMILFDYGQTLADQAPFDGIRGTEAVLAYADPGRLHHTAADVQQLADDLNRDIGRFSPGLIEAGKIEVHNYPFQRYLYEYLDIDLPLTPREVEKIFWDQASPAIPTPHIDRLLEFLQAEGIRTGVISNISFSGEALKERINQLLPDNHFEFILASSEYVFRKPHRRIFDLALRKAGLPSSDVWYCGDDVYCDLTGAAASGIQPVWYCGALAGRIQPEPSCAHLRLQDWNEMITWLQQEAAGQE